MNSLTAYNNLIEEFLINKNEDLIPIIEGIGKNIINELKEIQSRKDGK